MLYIIPRGKLYYRGLQYHKFRVVGCFSNDDLIFGSGDIVGNDIVVPFEGINPLEGCFMFRDGEHYIYAPGDSVVVISKDTLC